MFQNDYGRTIPHTKTYYYGRGNGPKANIQSWDASASILNYNKTLVIHTQITTGISPLTWWIRRGRAIVSLVKKTKLKVTNAVIISRTKKTVVRRCYWCPHWLLLTRKIYSNRWALNPFSTNHPVPRCWWHLCEYMKPRIPSVLTRGLWDIYNIDWILLFLSDSTSIPIIYTNRFIESLMHTIVKSYNNS